jgi:hypothetical protein
MVVETEEAVKDVPLQAARKAGWLVVPTEAVGVRSATSSG